MDARPILFSALMVREILAGTKTQTRRIVKPGNLGPGGLPVRQPTPDWNAAHYGGGMWSDGLDFAAFCPYGQPGDRLWVRETWAPGGRYAATDSRPGAVPRWRPSIHMPRAASRITLEITGVRVERLQDISEADALAEGIGRYDNGTFGLDAPAACMGPSAAVAYMRLWDHINGPGSWDANPWVWVVEFSRIAPPASPAPGTP